MKLTKGRIYQIIAIVLLLISMRSIDSSLYNLWKDGELAALDYSDNVLGITELTRSNIESLTSAYKSYGYPDAEESKYIAKVERAMSFLPAIKYICIAMIIVMLLRLSPAWGCIPMAFYVLYGMYLCSESVMGVISHLARYFEVLPNSNYGLMISVQYVFFTVLSTIAALFYYYADKLLEEEKKVWNVSTEEIKTKMDDSTQLANEQICYCTKCGAQQKTTARFCSKCGAEMSVPERQVDQDSI
ncbi:MAG: zinc ribbon domain-containing protein [Lachnospiraceae bacterium]